MNFSKTVYPNFTYFPFFSILSVVAFNIEFLSLFVFPYFPWPKHKLTLVHVLFGSSWICVLCWCLPFTPLNSPISQNPNLYHHQLPASWPPNPLKTYRRPRGREEIRVKEKRIREIETIEIFIQLVRRLCSVEGRLLSSITFCAVLSVCVGWTYNDCDCEGFMHAIMPFQPKEGSAKK